MKRVKIFSDADEYELEKQINSFLKEHDAQLIDLKLDVLNDDEAGKIITAVLTVDVSSEINYPE